MDRFLCLNLSFFHCRNRRVLLAFTWLLGLGFGAVLSYSAGAMLTSVISAAISGQATFLSLLSVLLLPVFLSVFTVYFSQDWLLLLVAFLKSVLFSFVAVGFAVAYGKAGWLVCGLVMFADVMELPLLWWFWLQSAGKDRKCVLRSGLAVVFGIVLIACFDFYTVAPFLASLLLF